MIPPVLRVPRRNVDATGTATIVATLGRDTAVALTLTLTVTADRAVRLIVTADDGLPLTDFQCWSDT